MTEFPPILDEIRRVRHAISAEFGHDPRKIVAHYRELQRRLGLKVVNLSGERAAGAAEGADPPVGGDATAFDQQAGS